MPRETPHAPGRVRKAAFAKEVLEDRRRGMTFQAIADKRKISRRYVRDIVKEAFTGLMNDKNRVAADALERSLQALDELRAAVWDQAMEGDVKSVGAAVAIIDRQARLLGLDAPARGEATVQFQGILATAELAARAAEQGLTLDQLRGPAPTVPQLSGQSLQEEVEPASVRVYTVTTPAQEAACDRRDDPVRPGREHADQDRRDPPPERPDRYSS